MEVRGEGRWEENTEMGGHIGSASCRRVNNRQRKREIERKKREKEKREKEHIERVCVKGEKKTHRLAN